MKGPLQGKRNLKNTLYHGFPAIDIAREMRLEYYSALEAYAVKDDLTPFAEMIAMLTEQKLDQYIEMAERS